MFNFIDDEGRTCYTLVISRKNHERVATLLYLKITMHHLPEYHVCSKILLNMATNIRYAFAALDILAQTKASLAIKSCALETSSCRCCMCYSRRNPIRRISNLTSTGIVLRFHSSTMQNLSSFLSRPLARLSTPLTPSDIKCVQQRPFSHRVFKTLTNEM